MKNIKLFLPLFLLLSGTKIIHAQDSLSAVLISSDGILKEKKISLEQLHSINALNILEKKGNQTSKISDVSYQITIIQSGKQEQVLNSQNETFDDKIKTAFKNINGKAKIYFEYINAIMPDKTKRKLSPIALEVQ